MLASTIVKKKQEKQGNNLKDDASKFVFDHRNVISIVTSKPNNTIIQNTTIIPNRIFAGQKKWNFLGSKDMTKPTGVDVGLFSTMDLARKTYRNQNNLWVSMHLVKFHPFFPSLFVLFLNRLSVDNIICIIYYTVTGSIHQETGRHSRSLSSRAWWSRHPNRIKVHGLFLLFVYFCSFRNDPKNTTIDCQPLNNALDKLLYWILFQALFNTWNHQTDLLCTAQRVTNKPRDPQFSGHVNGIDQIFPKATLGGWQDEQSYSRKSLETYKKQR